VNLANEKLRRSRREGWKLITRNVTVIG